MDTLHRPALKVRETLSLVDFESASSKIKPKPPDEIDTVITISLSPLYHTWYWKMRERDERNKVNIFHKEETK